MRKTYNIFKKLGRRNLALSIVALVLTSIMLVGATYSWIENITAVQITNMPQNGTGSDTSTLKLANDINKTIVLSNCGPDDKNGAISKFNAVNLGSYFNESGGMHLTTCSGNGESFYFKTLKGSEGAKKYRIGTEDDENVNYISATFMVSSPEADVDMWFNEIPTVKCGGNNNTDTIARYSITVDGETNVYSSSGDKYAHIKDADGNTEQVTVRKTAAYTFGHDQNVKDGKVNGNVLFRVGKEPKKVTVKIWLQYTENQDIYTDLKPDINMVLASTWAKTRRITIRDCTSDCNKEYWMTENDSPKLYVALASDPNKYHWELTIDHNTKTGTVDIPSYYYTGDEIYVFRIRSASKWGDDDYDGVIKVNVNGQQIPCWNYWKTKLPKGFDNLAYNIVGNTPAIVENDHTKQNDTGYSFWGEAERITVTDSMGLNNDTNVVRMLVHDTDTNFYYPLYPHSDHTWTGHIPRTSDKIEFLYKDGGFNNNAINSINSTNSEYNCYKNDTPDYRWGYKSTDTPPQTRPYNDTTYNIYGNDLGTWTDLVDSGYRINASFNDWSKSTKLYKFKSSDNEAFAYVNLSTNTTYAFKICNGDTSYTNDGVGVMTYSNHSDWSFNNTYAANNNNTGLITLAAGTYKFKFNISDKKVSVDYPDKGSEPYRIYLITKTAYNGSTKGVRLWWADNTSNKTDVWQEYYLGQNINGWYAYSFKMDGYTQNRGQFFGKDDNSDYYHMYEGNKNISAFDVYIYG